MSEVQVCMGGSKWKQMFHAQQVNCALTNQQTTQHSTISSDELNLHTNKAPRSRITIVRLFFISVAGVDVCVDYLRLHSPCSHPMQSYIHNTHFACYFFHSRALPYLLHFPILSATFFFAVSHRFFFLSLRNFACYNGHHLLNLQSRESSENSWRTAK